MKMFAFIIADEYMPIEYYYVFDIKLSRSKALEWRSRFMYVDVKNVISKASKKIDFQKQYCSLFDALHHIPDVDFIFVYDSDSTSVYDDCFHYSFYHHVDVYNSDGSVVKENKDSRFFDKALAFHHAFPNVDFERACGFVVMYPNKSISNWDLLNHSLSELDSILYANLGLIDNMRY